MPCYIGPSLGFSTWVGSQETKNRKHQSKSGVLVLGLQSHSRGPVKFEIKMTSISGKKPHKSLTAMTQWAVAAIMYLGQDPNLAEFPILDALSWPTIQTLNAICT